MSIGRRSNSEKRTRPLRHQHKRGEQATKTAATAALPPLTIVRWIALLAVVVLVSMRVLILFAPQIVFDQDPALMVGKAGGAGPAESLWLDVALLICCAIALFTHGLAGRRWNVIVLVFAVMPLPLVFYHGLDSAANMWIGASWMSAVVAGVTVFHLCQGRWLRVVALALLLAVAGPLVIRGLTNVTYEHERTVQQFEQNKDAILSDRGWSEESPSAQIFERRLRQRQPSGWFVSPNVFATLLAGCGLFFLSIVLNRPGSQTVGASRQFASTFAAAVLAGLCAVLLYMTGSKAAIVVTVAVAGLLVIALLPPLRARLQRWLPAIAIAGVLAVIGAVVVRGVLLPEDLAGEKSLLFRWHYMVASWRMLVQQPFTGVGPGEFQLAYVMHRLPISPEEVASAHGAFLDWLACLGLVGLAWVGMVLALLWRSGAAIVQPVDRTSDDGNVPVANNLAVASKLTPRTRLLMAVIAAIVVAGIPMRMEAEQLTAIDLALRLAGLVSFAAIAMVLMNMLLRPVASGLATQPPEKNTHAPVARATWLHWGVTAAALAVLMHSQVEMSLTQPAAAGWCLVLLGIAAARYVPGTTRIATRKASTVAVAAVPLCLAIFTAAFGAIPATAQQSLMMDAAQRLWPIAEARSRRQPVNEAEIITRRMQAAELLQRAYDRWPANPHPLIAAAEQHTAAASQRSGAAQREQLEAALSHILYLLTDHPHELKARSLATLLLEQMYQLDQTPRLLERAIGHALVIAQHDPHSIASWVRLGDLYWTAQQHQKAAAAYERALHNSDNFYLDPLKQLPDAERARIVKRLETVTPTNAIDNVEPHTQ